MEAVYCYKRLLNIASKEMPFCVTLSTCENALLICILFLVSEHKYGYVGARGGADGWGTAL